MKVLTVYSKNNGGGCFIRLCRMIVALQNNGNEVHYISTDNFPINKHKTIFHKLPRYFKNEYFFYFSFFAILPIYMVYIKLRYSIDVIAVFGTFYSLSALLVKLIFKVPIINFIRGDNTIEFKIGNRPQIIIKISSILNKLGLKVSDKVYTVTEDLKNLIKNQYNLREEKIDVFYNNIIQAANKDKIESEKKIFHNHALFVIGFVGKLKSIKRVDILINAFSMIKNANKKLLIVGDGSERNKLEVQIKSKGIDKDVIFTGWQTDIKRYLINMDLLVLPSEYEGCPSAILEALSCDVPSIGSNVGGIVEILKYEDLLFEAMSTKSLTEKLNRIITDKSYYKKITELCMERKKEFIFDWDNKIIGILKSAKLKYF